MNEKEMLEVFLHGVPVGFLTVGKKAGAATFSYYEQATTPLSVSLPLEGRTFDATRTRNWFENVMPEGDMIESLSRLFTILPKDYVEFLSEVGKECAGAITFGAPFVARGSSSAYENAKSVISNLPVISPEMNRDALRSVVSGFQPKLPMLLRDGEWVLPADGSLTTHIAKPEPSHVKGFADAEAWAMAIAGNVAKAAATDVVEFNGVRTLISKRFDRVVSGDRVISLHQEDLNSALGLPVERKYATVGGNKRTTPTLAVAASILAARAVDPASEIRELARHLTVNVLMGNLDWHAKNISFLYDDTQHISLAPMYDVVPSKHFIEDDHFMSLTVNNKFRWDRLFFLDLVNEVVSWGMNAEEAEQVIRETVDGVAASVANAEKLFPHRPEELVSMVNIRLMRFGAEPYEGE